jgi:hypothetical protein
MRPAAVALLVALSAAAPGARQPAAPERPPEGTVPQSLTQEIVTLRAEDGAISVGALYVRKDARPRTGVIAMHPKNDSLRNTFLYAIAEAGFAEFGTANRSVNEDGVHEEMLLDIAAGVRFLKSRGCEKIVLLGQSGGGPLMAFYQAQATTAPPGRVSTTNPACWPTSVSPGAAS